MKSVINGGNGIIKNSKGASDSGSVAPFIGFYCNRDMESHMKKTLTLLAVGVSLAFTPLTQAKVTIGEPEKKISRLAL